MFWRRLFGLIGIHFGGKPVEHEGKTSGQLKLGHILLAMIPAVVLGRPSMISSSRCSRRKT